MKHLWIASLLASCVGVDPATQSVARRLPRTFDVAVTADGTFSDDSLDIYDGDTVRWTFANPRQAIVSVVPPLEIPHALAAFGNPTAYVADRTDPRAFTGPMPEAPGGIFILDPNPEEPGLVERTKCSVANTRAQVGDTKLCATGPVDTVMDSSYADPAITGVFLRTNWSAVNPSRGNYDWTTIDGEIDKAIANGKLYSISVEAGGQGTPAWIFDAGVPELIFEEPGDNGCREVRIGSPTHQRYQDHYFAMLRELAAHLRARTDRFRALAYIKPSGANLFTAENRLPNECDGTCDCATETWAGAGYTRAGLLAFYTAQYQVLADEFPTKTLSYALIQAGFPLVLDSQTYVTNTSETSGPLWNCSGSNCPPFTAVEQTEDIIDYGVDSYGERFAVQHNGLGTMPDVPCPGDVGSGCPNAWVMNSHATFTGFQTQNLQQVASSEQLHSTLSNAYFNVPSAVFVEIYEERAWEARTRGGTLIPTPPYGITAYKTLAAWDEDFRARRGTDSLTYEFTFHTTEPLTLAYKEASKLASSTTGTIRVQPWP